MQFGNGQLMIAVMHDYDFTMIITFISYVYDNVLIFSDFLVCLYAFRGK